MVGWVVLHPQFTFLLNHTGKLETSLPPSVVNPFSALCCAQPPCRPAHVRPRLPVTSAGPTCASPQPRPPPVTAPGPARCTAAPRAFPCGLESQRLCPRRPQFPLLENGKSEGPGGSQPGLTCHSSPRCPRSASPSTCCPQSPAMLQGDRPPPGVAPSLHPSCRGGRSQRGGAAADPRNAVRPPRSLRRPAVLFLRPLRRPPGGRQGPGQALLSLRYVQARGPSGAPPANTAPQVCGASAGNSTRW